MNSVQRPRSGFVRMEAVEGDIAALDIAVFLIGQSEDGQDIYVRVGRYGPFLEMEEQRATLPDDAGEGDAARRRRRGRRRSTSAA